MSCLTLERLQFVTFYNGELGLLAEVQLRVTFDRGGHTDSFMHVGAMPLDPYHGNMSLYTVDAFWLVCLFGLVCRECNEAREKGICRKG